MTVFRVPIFAFLLLLSGSGALLRGEEALTTVASIRALSMTAATEGRPVRISGIVSYLRLTEELANDGKGFNFHVHDETGGIMIYPVDRADVQPGQFVTVTGVTAIGGQGLSISKAYVEIGEIRGLPAPRPTTVGEVLDGERKGDYVELEGIVRVVRLEVPEITPRRLAIDFGERDRRLTAWITRFDVHTIPVSPGNLVKLRGVVARWINPRGQLQSTIMLVNTPADLSVVKAVSEPAPVSIRDLLLWNDARSDATRLRTKGIVTYREPHELTVIQDEGFAIRIREAEATMLPEPGASPEPIRVGDRVEVIGFPALGEYTVELEDARILRTTTAAVPVPEVFPDASTALAGKEVVDRDALLVSIPARLHDIRERDGRRALEMESGNISFTAWLPSAVSLPDAIGPGAELSLTGICTLHLSGTQRRLGRAPDQFSLQLADTSGIRILRRAPWWNSPRLMLALAIAGGAALLLALWVGMLGKKNVLLREEISARERAEHQLSSERRRVAGELHDTLEQTLIAATLQLNAASRMLTTQPSVAAGQLSLAHQLVARSRQEVREAVWDLHAGEARGESLSALLERLCAESSGVAGADVSFAHKGSQAVVSAHVTTQAIRIVREAVANALKHAMPLHVRVTMRAEGGLLRLTVADDGCGFETASAPGPDEGHFGMASMEERIQRLGGTLHMESQLGSGTTYRFEIPLSPA